MFGKQKKNACTPGRKRFMTAVPLGIAFGFLCAYLASRSVAVEFWWTPLMWTIVTDRFLVGLLVALGGAYVIHPVFRFRCHPILRGAVLGAVASLPLATGGMMTPPASMSAWTLFWATVLAGAFYGAVIDLIATKVAGEGEVLIK